MPKLSPVMVVLFVILLVLFPILFGHLMLASLTKLHLGPGVAAGLVIAIILGGMVNIPVWRTGPAHELVWNPLSAYGLPQTWPRFNRAYRQTIIAVNLGGCVIPAGLAVYQLIQLTSLGSGVVAATTMATFVSSLVCFWVARPIAGLGIVMPGFVPPLTAAALAVFLLPHYATPVAFVAGVLGPLIGADLFHLREFARSGAGVASIGGAGTFDGIVLSGIVAAYLA